MDAEYHNMEASSIIQPIEARAETLPSKPNYTCPNLSISLPSPNEVRARGSLNGVDITYSDRPDPVLFPELRLIVKWGDDVTIAEGRCFWFIDRHLRQSVPVPQVLGWSQVGDQTFLYLELIEGDTLASRWDDLRDSEKATICTQLRDMISSWRRIVKPPGSAVPLSQIGDQPLMDIMFSDAGHYPAVPFESVSSFHDFFAKLLNRVPSRDGFEELAGLNDDIPVVFTHGDLNQHNIPISKPGDGDLRITGIIDWHRSGWYPEPWEFKARCVAQPGGDWVEKWLPTILEEPKYEYFYAWEYVSMGLI